MREILTILAIVLIVILTAALAVPYFIDWDAERSLVEAQLSNLTGAAVKIRGGIDLKLLPTPYLQLADVELAAPASGTDVKVAELHLELAPTALLRGEVDFVEARFVAPQIKLRLQNDALPQWRPRHGFTGQMSFERISVKDGSLVLDDPAAKRAYHFDNINLSAEADALTGPFRADGRFDMGGAPTAFRFSTGAREGAKLPVKLIFDQNALHPSADLDGSLIFHPSASAFSLPDVTGTLHLSGARAFDVPWQASGTLEAGLRKGRLSNLEVQFGDDLAATLDGSADFDLGATLRATIKLKAQQLDFDRLLTVKDAPVPMQRLRAAFTAIAAGPSATFFGMPLTFDLSAGTIILGRDALTGVSAMVSATAPQTDGLRFSAEGPGGAHVALDGRLETGSAPVFQGHVDAGADDVSRFQDWLSASLPELARPDLPPASVALDGDANISQVGAVGSGLMLHLNGSVLTGTLAYTKKIGTERSRLFADLSAQRLELPGLPDLPNLLAQTGDMDLALRFDARSVKLAGSKAGAIETGQIQFDFAKTGPASELKSLTISGFDGANVTASGHWRDAGGGELALQLDAPHAGEIASLVAHLAPGAETDFVAAHSSEFSPMHLSLALKGDGGAAKANLTGLDAAGTAGATQFLARATPAPGHGLDVSARAESPDARALLRQLGFKTFPGKKLGAATISATAQGALDHLQSRVSASLAGATLDFEGGVAQADKAPHAAGTLKIASADLAELLRAIGLADPNLQRALPLDLSAALEAGGDGLLLKALTGTCAGNKIAGSLSYAPDRGVTGTLETDRLALGALLQLALGPPRPAKPGALWSDVPFAAPVTLPPALVALHAGTFSIAPTIDAHDADFDLSLAGGQIGLQHFSAKLGEGRLFADLTLQRDGTTAAAAGHLSLDDYALDLPTARARVSGKFDFAGTGQSAHALVTGLAGSGALNFKDILLMRSDPSALAQVLSDVDEERLSIDETEIDRALSDAFDRHALSVDAADFDAGLAAGVLRLTGKASTPVGGNSDVMQQTQAAFDLRNLSLDQSSVLTLTALPRNWTGAPPQVAVEWSGPLDHPLRNLDASSFVNALAARAIARETARIEAQEFDVHEHAVALNRLQALRRQEAERLQASDDVKHAAERAREREATMGRLRQLLALEKQKAQPLPISPVPSSPAMPPAATAPTPAAPPPAVPADPSAAGRY
ncbi:AsmA family protein [uncultured Methylovirgula sp.]|uniref:AsmA family protein n=1 Tax=uncultured Methylovirgula sp. TaxID=1285960 RepID=UPI0026209A23|nr:AsmA family protein [uncultured Methylovirgula sp.]